MGKRDIQIDYDAIDDVLRELKKYLDGLEKMRNAVEKVNKTIHASNDAESIKKLEKRYKKTKKRLDDSYEEVNALYTLLKNYKNDMTAIIKPKKGMTREGRNDIYWNLTAIKAAIHEIQDVKSDVPLYYEDGTGCTDEEKQRMEENYQKLEDQIWTPILSGLNKALDDSKDKLEKYYKEKVVEYENMDDHYRWEAEKVRARYASTWEHMKQAGINYAEEQNQIAKGALRAVKDLAESLEFIGRVVYHVNGAEIAAVVKHLSPNPPEWTEKMLGESKDYFGEFAEILAHPVDVVKAMAQNASDIYEIEGASYAGAYIITDSLIGKATASGISKAVGKGAGAVDDIGKIANKADDVTDAAKITGKVDAAAEIAGITGKADDVTKIADDIGDFYDDVYKGCYEEPFNPIEEGVMLDPDDVVDVAEIESEMKKAAVDKFTTIRENWIDDVKAEEFINALEQYAQKSVDIGACNSIDDFYRMYFERSYTYSDEFIKNIKKPYLDTGASSIINAKDIENAVGRFETIGRAEHGNFTTSALEDFKLLYDSTGNLVNTETIESIKGVDPGKYTTGVYQYSYDSELVNSIDDLHMIRTVNGKTPGASAVNIPGGYTWAGENIKYSESEWIMPSIDVSKYDIDDVLDSINKKGYFEINNPTIISPDGSKIQAKGTFKIKKIGE